MSTDMPEDSMDPANLKKAFKTFKKRIRLMRLDAESTLGNSPLSGGQRSGIVGIRPPSNFPQEVWEKLVETGKLTKEGNGLYGLVDDPLPA